MLIQPLWLRESYAIQMSVMVLIPGINKALVFFALDLDSCLLYVFLHSLYEFHWQVYSQTKETQSNSGPLPMFLSQASATSSL